MPCVAADFAVTVAVTMLLGDWQAIAKQVLFRERQSYLVDEAAFRDAEMSLRNMLRDFVNERKNKVPEELR